LNSGGDKTRKTGHIAASADSDEYGKLYEVTAKLLNYYRKREWDSVMAIIEVGRSAADHFA
jgi:hypothetical protein